MRLPGKIILLMMALITAPQLLIGCAHISQKESTATNACIELMQKVPVYYEDFEFWDVNTLRNDSDLKELYQIWYERKVNYLEELFGLNVTDIKFLAQGEGMLDIIKTDYDIDELRKAVAADFYRDTKYPDMEVWKSEPSSDPQSVTGGWVLTEGLIVRGANNSNVDDYLRVVSGEELSMYDKNAAEVLDMLPQGFMTRLTRSMYPKGLIISGMTLKKEHDTLFKWTNLYKFDSPADIQSAETDAYFQGFGEGFEQMNEALAKRGETASSASFIMKKEGNFIEWSVLIEEEYMIGLLFYD